MAVAAVELAERYQRNRMETAVMRWFPLLIIIVAGYLGISAAVNGDKLSLLINAVIVLGNVAEHFFNPAARPSNMARSLKASRRIAVLAEPELSDLGVRAHQVVESPEGALVDDEASVRRLLGP